MRRAAQAALIVFIVASLTFVLIHAAPGDPFSSLRESGRASPQVIAVLQRRYGLDQPLTVQYVKYIRNLARGDLGESLSKAKPVWVALREQLPNTLILAFAALVIDFGIGIAVGAWQGTRAGSIGDRVISTASLTLYSVPVFWLGMVAILVFAEWLDWLPPGNAVDAMYYTFTPLGKIVDRLEHLILPALTLGLIGAAATARFQRAALLEVVRQDFVRTARAKGLSERRVLWHALRNALLPAITLLGLALPFLLSGVVLVEYVFSWPGIGLLSKNALDQRDYPLVTGAAILTATMVTAGSVVADILYHVVDPRTREVQ